MVWCVHYSSLETVDWSLYKFGGEGVKIYVAILMHPPTDVRKNVNQA